MKKQSWMILMAVVCCLSSMVMAEESWLSARFGKDLRDASGKAVSVKSLKGKVIGVYFSAHWCPPCRQFTPKLVAFRNENKASFEVVFISFDHSAAAMQGYMKEMKMAWAALPWKGEKANAIKAEFNVRGIPTLIVFDQDGHVLSLNARKDVETDPARALKTWKAGKQSD